MTAANSAGPPRSGVVILLAAGAALILAVGSLLKPPARAKDLPVTLTEAATLGALSRRDQLRDMTRFLAERAEAAGTHLIYLPEGQAAVIWDSAATALTPGAADEPPLKAARLDSGGGGVPAVAAGTERITGRGWVVVAARQPDGSLAWSVGMHGGTTVSRCGPAEYRQLVLGVPLAAAFLGGGVFDLDGHLLGIVARCGESYSALAVTEIAGIIEAPGRTAEHAGLEVTRLDSLARSYFTADSGVLVSGLLLGSPIYSAGLRPGDVIALIDGSPAGTPAEVSAAISSDTPPRELAVLRGGQLRRLVLPSAATARSLGLAVADPADELTLTSVVPGSRAAAAGLRTGDRIVRVGTRHRPTRAAALRTLESTRVPVYVVFRRDIWERGTFLLP